MKSMRQIAQSITVMGIAVLLMTLPIVPSAFAQAELPGSIQALAQEVQTPRSLERFMKKNLRYVSDRAQFGKDEFWQTPEEMLKRRIGDCEDYALFAQAALRQMGYKAFVISLFWEGDAHAVAVFEADGKWGVFNLDKLTYTDARSLADLAKHIHPDWSYIALMRAEGNVGVISQKFLNKTASSIDISTALFRAVKPMTFAGPLPATAASSEKN